MSFSTPCDACHVPLSGRVLSIRVSSLGVAFGATVAHRLIPVERPSDYLLCPSCGAVLDAYIRHLEVNRGVPPAEAV